MQNIQQFAVQTIEFSKRCVFFTDTELRLNYLNDACLLVFGADSKDQLIGRLLEDIPIDPEIRIGIDSATTKLLAGEKSFEQNLSVKLEGAYGILSFRSNRVLDDESGELVGFGYVLDAQSYAENFEQDKIIINNLMRNTQDLIYFKDLDSRFTRISSSMVEKFGANSMEDVIGKSDFDFWEAESAESFYETEQEIIRTRQPLLGKTEAGVRPDGNVTWSLTSKMPLFDKNNQVIGTFGINKDITLQKEFQLELEQTHQELIVASRRAGMAEIATNVLHNIGNVLNSINVSVWQIDEVNRGLKIGKLETVATMLDKNAEVAGFLADDERGQQIPTYLKGIARQLTQSQQKITTELEHAKNYLEHVKAIVSMQQEYAISDQVLEEVDICDILEDAIRISSRSLAQHQITLIRNFEPGKINVTTDKHRVLQTLVNLIRNAKRAMTDFDRDDKQMTITTHFEDSSMVTISVTDNGVGIPAENLVKLFGHGFTTKKGGHGFGLHSSANFARALGGSLVAASDGPGKGATFTLTLPTTSKPHSSASLTAVPPCEPVASTTGQAPLTS